MTAPPVTPHDCIAAITSGLMDDHMDALVAAVNARIKYRRASSDAAARVGMRVGSRVRSLDTVRPERLAGREGTVTGFGRSRVNVDLDGLGPCRFTAASLVLL